MGDSDRMKNYISDYLENSLDPSTHKEFEDALKRSPELRAMTDRVASMTTQLKNLEPHKCSDDFSVKLRERIHTSSEPIISRQNLVRYSFAASFIVIVVLATFTITNLMSESPDEVPPLQGSSQTPVSTPNPVSGPASPVDDSNKLVSDKSDKEVGVKSKSTQNAVSDSTGIQPEKKKNKPPIKYVNQKNLD